MKKRVSGLLTYLIWLSFTSATFMLTSCSDDSDSNSVVDDERYPYFSFSVDTNGDLPNIADIKVFYTDADAAEQSETLLNRQAWKKTFIGNGFPYTVGYRVFITLKDQELTKESYRISVSTSQVHALADKDGNLVSSYNSNSIERNTTVVKENVQHYIDLLNEEMNYKFTMDAEGAVVSVPD